MVELVMAGCARFGFLRHFLKVVLVTLLLEPSPDRAVEHWIDNEAAINRTRSARRKPP